MTIQRDDDLILRIIEDSDEPQQHRHPRHRNPVSDDNLQFEDEFHNMNNNSAGFLPEDNANNALAFSFRSWSNSSSVTSLSVIDIFEPSSIDDLEQQMTDILRMSSQTPRRAPRRGRNNNNNNNNDNPRSFGGGGDMDQYIPTIREMNDAFGHDSFGINRDRMAGAGTATTTGNPRRSRRWTRRGETRAASSSSIDEQQLDYQQEQQQEDNNSFNQSGSIICLDLSTNNNDYNGGSFSSLGDEFAHDSLRLIRRGGGRNNNGDSLSGLLCNNFNANESQSFDLAKSERGCPDIPET